MIFSNLLKHDYLVRNVFVFFHSDLHRNWGRGGGAQVLLYLWLRGKCWRNIFVLRNIYILVNFPKKYMYSYMDLLYNWCENDVVFLLCSWNKLDTALSLWVGREGDLLHSSKNLLLHGSIWGWMIVKSYKSSYKTYRGLSIIIIHWQFRDLFDTNIGSLKQRKTGPSEDTYNVLHC